jgi:acyl-CoA thioester hydrolase
MRRGADQVTVSIRWADIDALGHVNHTVFLNYLEEVRDAWLTSATQGRIARDEIVLARVEIDFLKPVVLADRELFGECHLVSVGNKSLRTAERLLRSAAEEVVRAESTSVLWDPQTSRSRALTDDERKLLGDQLGSPDP